MLRNAVRERPPQPFVKRFSTWLDTYHVPLLTSDNLQGIPESPRRFASTSRLVQKSAAKVSEPPLPRFLRRQVLQRNANKSSDTSPQRLSSSSEPPSAFRSRHYNPSQQAPEANIRLLDPHVLSARLKTLCNAGKIDDAIYMLKNAPLDAQNTPVWNTLIWETLKVKRYQLAYQLFVDMKRRGFSPTTRTFQTFFNGLSKIEHWPTHPKQLTNARSLYDAFLRHVASLKRHDPRHPDLSVDPLAGYIRILGSAGLYQELFDVYYALDHDGFLPPNQYIFTAMFHAIAAAKNDTTEGRVKVAADARMLWSQMMKVSTKTKGFTPDSHTVVAALGALGGGNKPDHDFAFRLVAQYFGLEADRTVSKFSLLPLRPESLAAILRLCIQSENYALATQFLQQVKRRSESTGGASIIDRAHVEEVLRAECLLREPGLGYHAVEMLEWMLRREITGANGPKIRPAASTYNLVMQACWRSSDWNSATRAFDLMTGYHCHDFMDGSVAQVPRFDKRGPGRNFPADAEFMSSMLRTALATKNRAYMRQALRIVNFLGFENIFKAVETDRKETSKTVKGRAFHGLKFASATIEIVASALEENGKYAKPDEAKKWRVLATEAKVRLDEPNLTPSTLPKATKGKEYEEIRSKHAN